MAQRRSSDAKDSRTARSVVRVLAGGAPVSRADDRPADGLRVRAGAGAGKADASVIRTRRWDPPAGTPVRARGVYLLHGFGEHGARYERLAVRLAADGYRVAAHDHPGHGESGGPRGVADPPDALAREAAVRVTRFAEESGAAPYVFGHSLGGVIALELSLAREVPLAGLMLSAPAIVPRLSRADTIRLRVLSAFAPTYAVERPYDASRLTHDPEQIAAAHADPLIHGFKSAGLVGWLIDNARRVLDAAPRLEVKTLLLVAGDDLLIDIARTQAFAERAPEGLVTLVHYEGYYHELLNETPERRERVEDDILGWLTEREAEVGGATSTG